MRKIVIVMAALLMMAGEANAVPAKPGQWRTLTLADGTTVRVEARGDEYSSWWQDAQGQCYVQQGDTFVMTDMATINAQRYAARERFSRPARRSILTSTIDGLGYRGWNSQGSQYSLGEWEIPVLLVDFSDTKFSAAHTPELMQDYLTKEGFTYNYNDRTYGVGSVRDFFVAQSKGVFKPNFRVLGKVTVDKSYKYYGENIKDEKGNILKDYRVIELAGDAMRAAKAQIPGVDFKKYDIKAQDEWHNDGIPLIVLLFAGSAESEHSDDQPDLIWPHELDMATYKYNGVDTDFRTVKLSDTETVTLNSYFVGQELTDYITSTGVTVEGLAGIGIMVHELGHALGLPDWYATRNDPETGLEPKTYANNFGDWSVMDTGPYCGGNAYWTPMGYTAYERSYLGWWSIGSVAQSGSCKLGAPYTLAPETDNIAGDCLLFRRSNDVKDAGFKEYFIIETRQPATWYPNDLGTGLLLTRYSYDEQAWKEDAPNNVMAKRRARVITADGMELNYNAANSNLYGNGVNTISGQKFMSGAAWDVTISNIKKNTDGSVEFDLQLPTDGIETVKTSKLTDDSYYDLQGRRVDQPTKGLYIYKGKKVVIK